MFPSTTQYYALFQETLELAIGISDPEGLPVTVSLEGNSKGAVIHQNVLRWNVSSDSSTHFSLKATDACHASATLNITVKLVDCQCKNGSCVPHPNKPRGSGLYECSCLPGFSGSKCETHRRLPIQPLFTWYHLKYIQCLAISGAHLRKYSKNPHIRTYRLKFSI